MPTEAQRSWLVNLGVSSAASLNLPNSRTPATGPSAPAPSKPPDKDAVVLPEDTITAEPPVDGKPPKATPFTLSASVGRGGKNKPDDVKAVQAALNDKAKANLQVDGKCGSNTLDAIKKFQASLGMKKPDRLVDPGKRTALALGGTAGSGSPGESGGAKGDPTSDGKGNKAALALTKEAEAALHEADKILKQQLKTRESCEGWMGKVTETFAEVADKADLAEGKALVAKLEKSFKEHCKLVEQVEAAAGKLKAQPAPAAVTTLQKACERAHPGFAQLSELTDQALQWWGVNATPEWAKQKSAGVGAAKPGITAGGASLPTKKAAAIGNKDYPELPPDVQEMVDAIEKKRQQGKKSPEEAEKETKDMIRRKMGLGAEGWQNKFKNTGSKFSIGADDSDTKSGADSGSEGDGDES